MRCSKCSAEFDVFPAVCPQCAEPVVLAGRYEIKQLIGRGGMGEVYLAYDRRLATEVALKRVPARFAMDPDLARALTKEARLLAQLTDDCIVRMFDLAGTPEGLFLILEYVCGPSLQEMLSAGYRLPVAEILLVLSFVCKGLTAAHSTGIIHRDLKPGNFLVSLSAEERQQFRVARRLPANLSNARIKLADFGIAKASSPGMTTLSSGTMLISGTPAFMAPEQFRGETPSPETDVYALGVIAYMLLAGKLPFAQGDMAHCHQFVQPPPLPNGAGAVNQVVQRALAKARRERFASAREFYEALAGAAEQGREPPPLEVVAAKPAEPPPRPAPPPKPVPPIVLPLPDRNPPLAGILAGIAVILVVLVGAVAWAMHSFGGAPSSPSTSVERDEFPADLELRGPPSVTELPPIVEEARGRLSLKGVNGPSKGRVVWKVAIPFSTGARVAAIGVDSTIYVTGHSEIAAVRDGRLAWAYSVPDVSLDPIGQDGRIRIWSHNRSRIDYCLNRDGQGGLLHGNFAAPQNHDPTSHSDCRGRTLAIYDKDYGGPTAGAELDNDCSSDTLALDGAIYVGTKMPSLYCVRPDGGVVWKIDLPCAAQQLVGGEGGRLIFTCRDHSMHFVENGKFGWTIGGGDRESYSSTLIDAQGTTFFADTLNGSMARVNSIARSGQSAWTLDIREVTAGTLNLDGKGRLYMTGRYQAGIHEGLFCISE